MSKNIALLFFTTLTLSVITIFVATTQIKLPSRAASNSQNLLSLPLRTSKGAQTYKKGEILVKLNSPLSLTDDIDFSSGPVSTKRLATPSQNAASLVNILKANNIKSVRSITHGAAISTSLQNTYLLNLPKNQDVMQTIDNLKDNAEVLTAQPNYVYSAAFSPNDPYFQDSYPSNPVQRSARWNPPFDYQWNLKIIGSEAAWDIVKGQTMTKIKVAVLDSGIDYTHKEFGGCTLAQINTNTCAKIAPGYDFIELDADPMDEDSHGTFVSSIIASITNNALFVASIADNVQIVPIRVLDENGNGTTAEILSGITSAMSRGVRVINMSLSTGTQNDPLVDVVISTAYANGITIVAASGNDGASTIDWPSSASCPGADCVISVGSSTTTDTKSTFSNYGRGLDLVAPGGGIGRLPSSNDENIIGLYFNQTVRRASGTSSATPHVAAAAALILGINPNLTPLEVQDILTDTAVDIETPGHDILTGHGRLDLHQALLKVLPQQPDPTSVPTPTPTNAPNPTSTPTPTQPPIAACTFFPVNFIFEQLPNGSYKRLTNLDRDIWGSLNNKVVEHIQDQNLDETSFFQQFNKQKQANGKDKGFDANGEYDPCDGKPCTIAASTCCGYGPNKQYNIKNGERATIKLFYDKANYVVTKHCFNADPTNPSDDTADCYDVSGRTDAHIYNDPRLIVQCGNAYRYGWVIEKKSSNSPVL